MAKGKFYSVYINNRDVIAFLDSMDQTTWRLADGRISKGRNGFVSMWLALAYAHRSELWPQLFGIKAEIKEGDSQ
jgi:hypothetical protein